MDLSFVQLLVAARTSARRSDNTVVFGEPPDGVLLDTLTRAGFRVTTEMSGAKAGSFWFDGDQV